MGIKAEWIVRPMLALGLGMVALTLSSLAALAQSNTGSQDLTRGLTDPKNGGVAGTGMGTTDKASGGVGSGGATGTGMSVKGPAGQGINGSETKGMSGSDSPTKPVGQ